MKAGFARVDITPRTGVELAGFGPYIHRYALDVRDGLYARAGQIPTRPIGQDGPMGRDQRPEPRDEASELGEEPSLPRAIEALPVREEVLLAVVSKAGSEIFDGQLLGRSGQSVHSQVRRSLL